MKKRTRKTEGKGQRKKRKASPRTPLRRFEPDFGLSKKVMDRIGRELVNTNKTFKEIGAELGLDPSIIGGVNAFKNFRTSAEHREIIAQRAVEKRKAREEARKRKLLSIKTWGISLPRTKAMDWVEKNYRSLPDLGFHITSLADARSMLHGLHQGRMLRGHFYVADAGQRAKEFQEYYGKLYFALSGLFNRRLEWPANEHAGALVLIAYKLPSNPAKYLGEKDTFPVQGFIHPLAVKSASLVHLTAGEVEKARRKFLPEFKRLKEMHLEMPVEEIEKRHGPVEAHWPSAGEVEEEFKRSLWAAFEKEIVLDLKRIKRLK